MKITYNKTGILIALLLAAAPVKASGGREKGTGIVIINSSLYQTSSTYDSAGKSIALQNDGRFQKLENNTYLEYGITNSTTFTGNFFVTKAEYSDHYGSRRNTGLSDSEFGLRHQMNSLEAPVAWSFEGIIKAPTSKSSGTPAIADHQTDIELRTGFGGNFTESSAPPFWKVGGGYRFRFAGPADQVRFDAAVGMHQKRLMELVQVFGIKSVHNNAAAGFGENPTLTPAFDLYKAQASMVYRLTSRASVQVGYARNLAGRNTGTGGGPNVALWWSF